MPLNKYDPKASKRVINKMLARAEKELAYPKSDPRKLKPIVKQLDSLVSKIVIARDGKCVLCGSRTALGCGHWQKRAHRGVRWNLDNCNCLCNLCNSEDEITPYIYTSWMEDNYGFESMAWLRENRDVIIKPIQQHAIYRELQEVAKQFGIHAPNIPLTK